MSYSLVLLLFGVFPLALVWLNQSHLIRQHAGSLLVIVVLILMVSIPWEMLAINRIWYYSPRVIWGVRLLNLPVEELAFFVINGLLVGRLALLFGEYFRVHH